MQVQGAKTVEKPRHKTRGLLSLAAIALTALVLAGCGATTGERAASGAGVGAATGAGAGAATGGSATRGAVIGAGVGAAAGALTDEEDIDLSQ
nr:glycine zipper domain-containing protein [Halomonas socia]